MTRYALERFTEKLDDWIALEAPTQDLRSVVTAWVLSRFEDPYLGVRREPGFDNLWFGAVPNTVHEGRVVTCSYWVNERQRVVRCDRFATLSLPI